MNNTKPDESHVLKEVHEEIIFHFVYFVTV